MRTVWILLMILLSLALGGCSASLTPAGESPELPPLEPQDVPSQLSPTSSLPDSATQLSPDSPLPDTPAQGEATQMNPSLPIPALPTLQNLIEKAKQDLAQRLSLSTTQINLLEATEVIWLDSSLGCPQKGMEYTQILTPGYLIRLESSGNIFEYHTSMGRNVIYCEDPTPPVSGTTDSA